MKHTQTGNCPFCDSERGIHTAWGMSESGMADLRDRHNKNHPENTGHSIDEGEKKDDFGDFIRSTGKDKEKVMLEIAREATDDQRKQIGLEPLPPQDDVASDIEVNGFGYIRTDTVNYLLKKARTQVLEEVRVKIEETRGTIGEFSGEGFVTEEMKNFARIVLNDLLASLKEHGK